MKPRTWNLLQECDPRMVLLVWGMHSLLLASTARDDLPGTLLMGAFPVFASFATGSPSPAFASRLRLAAPFVALLVIGETWAWASTAHTVSAPWIPGTVLAIKLTTSMLALDTLEKSISLDRLAGGLRTLGVPDPLVDQLLFLHRYGNIVAREALTMRRARDLRARGNQGRGLKATASLLGTFFLRCHDRANRVHRSMLLRGFTGRLPPTAAEPWNSRDLAWGGITLVLLLVARFAP